MVIILELSHPIVWLVRHVCSDKINDVGSILFLAMTVATNTSDRPNVSLVHG